jgi:hypothetical protein
MTEVSKQLMCICIRNGTHLWVEKERVEQLQALLARTGNTSRFIDFDGQTINTADIVGIFTAETMSEVTRRKNGEWQCEYKKWHHKGDEGENEHYWCKEDAKKKRAPISNRILSD